MAKESMFSTPREKTLTGEEMLENAIKRKQIQRQNMQALTEARKMVENTEDFTHILESNQLDEEEKVRKEIATENAYYQRGAKLIARDKIGMKSRLVTEGMEQVWNDVIGNIIYESYWLDDPIKEATIDQITESITDVLEYIEENCIESKVPANKYSRFINNLESAIETIVKEVAERITNEATEKNISLSEFELNEEEEKKLDDELVDLGKDEIVELIKDKVAQVVQDERERGKEKAEAFSEIEEKSSDEDDEDADDDIDGDDEGADDSEETETEESTLYSLEEGFVDKTKNFITDDTNKKLKETFFEKKGKEASDTFKKGLKLYKSKKYREAKKELTKARKLFIGVKKDISKIDDTKEANVKSLFKLGSSYLVGWKNAGSSAHNFSRANLRGEGTGNALRNNINVNLDTAIQYCDDLIVSCDNNIKAGTKVTLKEALNFDPTDSRYTASEKYMANLLETGAPLDLTIDPNWNEFKACISLLCKKVKNILMMDGSDPYCAAIPVIDELISRLSVVPEDAPTDIKEFVMAMVSIIYGAVPSDEVIINRMNSGLGSPDITSSYTALNLASISWMDILVNVKTNLNSIKNYCNNKCSEVDTTPITPIQITPSSTFESLLIQKKSRALMNGIGGTLFEAMMIGNIATNETAAMESSMGVDDEDVEDAALVETVLQYTVFETLSTLGLYKFKSNDIRNVKKDCINSVTEGIGPFNKDKKDKKNKSKKKSQPDIMKAGKGKDGKKRIRIRTKFTAKKKSKDDKDE